MGKGPRDRRRRRGTIQISGAASASRGAPSPSLVIHSLRVRTRGSAHHALHFQVTLAGVKGAVNKKSQIFGIAKYPSGERGASELLEARALRVGTQLERHVTAIGSMAAAGGVAGEIDHTTLVIRVALESLAVNLHRLAGEVDAARPVRFGFIGHGCQASQ